MSMQQNIQALTPFAPRSRDPRLSSRNTSLQSRPGGGLDFLRGADDYLEHQTLPSLPMAANPGPLLQQQVLQTVNHQQYGNFQTPLNLHHVKPLDGLDRGKQHYFSSLKRDESVQILETMSRVGEPKESDQPTSASKASLMLNPSRFQSRSNINPMRSGLRQPSGPRGLSPQREGSFISLPAISRNQQRAEQILNLYKGQIIAQQQIDQRSAFNQYFRKKSLAQNKIRSTGNSSALSRIYSKAKLGDPHGKKDQAPPSRSALSHQLDALAPSSIREHNIQENASDQPQSLDNISARPPQSKSKAFHGRSKSVMDQQHHKGTLAKRLDSRSPRRAALIQQEQDRKDVPSKKEYKKSTKDVSPLQQVLLKEYKRDVESQQQELLKKMQQSDDEKEINEEQFDVESAIKQRYEQSMSQMIKRKVHDLQAPAVESGKKRRAEESNIDRYLRQIAKDNVKENTKKKLPQYSDSEDEVSYGQYGDSFYTKIQTDEDLLAKKAQLLGKTRQESIENQDAKQDGTMNEDMQVGTRNLQEENIASPKIGSTPTAEAQPGGSLEIREEEGEEADDASADATASHRLHDERMRSQGQDLKNDEDDDGEVNDLQAPLKFIQLLNNYNHYELRNIFMNIDLTDEEKQELVKQGHKDVLQMFNDMRDAHRVNERERAYQRIIDNRQSAGPNGSVDDTASQQWSQKTSPIFDKQKINLLDKIAERMYVESKIGQRNSLIQSKVYAKKNVRLGAAHTTVDSPANADDKADNQARRATKMSNTKKSKSMRPPSSPARSPSLKREQKQLAERQSPPAQASLKKLEGPDTSILNAKTKSITPAKNQIAVEKESNEPKEERQAPLKSGKPTKASPFKTSQPIEKINTEDQQPEAEVAEQSTAHGPADINKKMFQLQNQVYQLDVSSWVRKRSLERFRKLQEWKETSIEKDAQPKQYSSKNLDDGPYQIYTRKVFEKNVENKKQKMIKGLTNDQQMVGLIQIEEDQAVDTLEQIERRSKESMWKKFGQRNVFSKIEEHDDEILDYLSLFNNNQHAHLSAIGQNVMAQLKIAKAKRRPSYLFDKYVEDQEDYVQEIGLMLKERFRYNKVFKEYAEPTTGHKFENDAKFQYFLQCQRDQDVILPVLDYVHQKTLCLQSYTLSIAQCNGLAKAFGYFDKFINRVIFDNCGIDDQEFAAILNGIKKLKDFKKIIYRRNEFHVKSLAEFKGILSRKIPHHLEEFRLENCKIEPSITEKLIEHLNEKCYIKNLALVNANLNANSFKKLTKFMEESQYLQLLDISWNHLRPQCFFDFMDVLQNINQLLYINLSSNLLFEDQMSENYVEKKLKKKKGKKKEKYKFDIFDEEKDQIEVFSQELSQKTRMTIENLLRFIKKCHFLIHADFSDTGMSEKILWYFGRSMRRTKSLRALHLSNNPGITPRVVEYLKNRIHAKEGTDVINTIDFTKLPSTLQKKTEQQEGKDGIGLSSNLPKIFNMQSQGSRLTELTKDYIKHQKGEHERYREVAQAKHIMYHKKIETDEGQADAHGWCFYSSNKGTPQPESDKVLIFTRQIGHKEDMPGSGQWRVITKQPIGEKECWICDKQVYSLIFWNELIGAASTAAFSQEDRKFVLEQLTNINRFSAPPPAQENKVHCPYIYGQFTNWEPKRMFEIREYCDRIDLEKPNIFNRLQQSNAINPTVEKIEELTDEEKELYYQEVKAHYDKYSKTWKEIIQKYMKYEKPNIVNAGSKALVHHQDVPLFVYPCFMRCGKQYFCVKYNKLKIRKESKTPQWSPKESWFFDGCVVPFRKEPVPSFRKTYKTHIVRRIFRKESSVFAKWMPDDRKALRQCFEHDAQWWKCSRFVKDPDDMKKLINLVKAHYPLLKANFLYGASSSDFPWITMGDFTLLSKKLALADRFVPQSAIDRQFIAVNVELEQQAANPDKALMRFEFIEALIRIAHEKFVRWGTYKTYAEAFKVLLEEHLIPHGEHHQWQEFRQAMVWTVDVNDVFQVNLDNLRLIYNSYCGPPRNAMGLDDMLDLIMKKSELGLHDRDVVFSYGMSKMTVIEENSEEGERKYGRLLFVEFLECLARLAYAKFHDSELQRLPMHQKIEHVLDDVFEHFGLQRQAAGELEQVVTDSDSDY